MCTYAIGRSSTLGRVAHARLSERDRPSLGGAISRRGDNIDLQDRNKSYHNRTPHPETVPAKPPSAMPSHQVGRTPAPPTQLPCPTSYICRYLSRRVVDAGGRAHTYRKVVNIPASRW